MRITPYAICSTAFYLIVEACNILPTICSASLSLRMHRKIESLIRFLYVILFSIHRQSILFNRKGF